MNTENQAVRIKFVNQLASLPYEKTISELDELNVSEKDEMLSIYLRLKKRTFYQKVMIEELIPFCSSESVKEKALNLLKININSNDRNRSN